MKMGEELLRERERLLVKIEEGKQAAVRLKQVNVLIAMYGDDIVPGDDATTCPRCPGKTFKGEKGLRHHQSLSHKAKPRARVRKRPATSTRRPTRRAA